MIKLTRAPSTAHALMSVTVEDAAAIEEILKRAYWSCLVCFGTGWKNYRDFRNAPGYEPLAPQVECPRCHGLGSVQHNEV